MRHPVFFLTAKEDRFCSNAQRRGDQRDQTHSPTAAMKGRSKIFEKVDISNIFGTFYVKVVQYACVWLCTDQKLHQNGVYAD